MKGVTEDGGTAYSTFAGFDIEVAGKTGSAETGDPDKVNGWFVGFAPFDDPEISVTVLIENAGSGGFTAETARDIMAEYFGMNANEVKRRHDSNSKYSSTEIKFIKYKCTNQ